MNWFERYGIVGFYYVILSICWLRIFSGNWDWVIVQNSTTIIAILAGISLPAGYLINILSQNIYYILPEELKVHKTACKDIPSLPNYYDEKCIESYLAIKQRLLSSNNNNIENLKWLQGYVRKRWDVLAISSSMILATNLAAITSFLLCILPLPPLAFLPNSILMLAFSLLSVIIIGILWWSRNLMFDQIVQVYKREFVMLR